jgi:type IV pilus assembly protein PilO
MALKDYFTNIPRKQKILLVALLFVAVIAAFYFFVYRGMVTERDALTQKRDGLRSELNEKRILAANLDRLKTEIVALESQLAQALLVLPEEKEIPKLLVTINSLGLKAGIGFLLFRPGSLATRDFYGEFPVQMKVQGTYHDLGRFFDSISRMPRIVNVSDLKITALPPSKEVEDTIIAEFVATTFTFAGSRGGKSGAPGKAS